MKGEIEQPGPRYKCSYFQRLGDFEAALAENLKRVYSKDRTAQAKSHRSHPEF